MKIRTRRGKRRPLRDGSYVRVVKTIEHNMNAPVRVKLTDYGMTVWRQIRLDNYADRWRNRPQTEADRTEFDKEFRTEVGWHHVGRGWYEFKTYELWALFGRCFYEGMAVNAKLPFETTVRYVDKGIEVSSSICA